MANVKISDLSAGSTPTGTEAVAAVQGATTVKLTLNQMAGSVFQGSNANLAALAAQATTGIIARTGSATYANRTITPASTSRLTVTNGDGVSGNPTLDLATSGVSANTYTKVTVDVYGRVTVGANPTTLAGYGITDAQGLSAELTALAAAATTGSVHRTGTATYAQRTLTGTASQIIVANGDGVSGNPTVSLATGIVTPSTYKSVTVDTTGRVTAGTNPTTLSGYGITDAQPLNTELTGLASQSGTGYVVRTGSGSYLERTLGVGTGLSITNADGVAGATTISPGTELTGLAALAATGIIARTASGTYAARTLTSTGSTLTITNPGGVAAAPNLDLASGVATPGTYTSVTVDTFGRVTAGTSTGSPANVTINAQSSGYTILAADKGKLVDYTGSADATFAFTAAATLGAGFWCYVRNNTSDDTKILTLDPNSSETIDTVSTIKEGFGGTLLVTCDGSNFSTVRMAGGFIRFTSSSTFTEPTRIREKRVAVIGAGGGGGSGAIGGGTGATGGAGGGGGCHQQMTLATATVNNTTSVVIGASGTGGASINSTGISGGNSGSAGGFSSFGAYIYAYGGGGGGNGVQPNAFTSTMPGGGGGSVAAGSTGVQGAGSVSGGGPTQNATGTTAQASGSAGSGNTGTSALGAEWGGACGGFATIGAGFSGSCSMYGGSGGGAGGTVTGSTVATAGGNGGLTSPANYASSAGGGGAAGGAAGGSVGTAGVASPLGAGGGGGGGGAAGNATGSATGGAGGAGGTPGGGGGGGGGVAINLGSSTGITGAGGAGGRGEVRVWYW